MMVQHDGDFFNVCIFSIESFYKAFIIIKRNNLMIDVKRGEIYKIMQTFICILDLHNLLEFSKFLSCLAEKRLGHNTLKKSFLILKSYASFQTQGNNHLGQKG